jgi:hypothetical protein
MRQEVSWDYVLHNYGRIYHGRERGTQSSNLCKVVLSTSAVRVLIYSQAIET